MAESISGGAERVGTAGIGYQQLRKRSNPENICLELTGYIIGSIMACVMENGKQKKNEYEPVAAKRSQVFFTPTVLSQALRCFPTAHEIVGVYFLGGIICLKRKQ